MDILSTKVIKPNQIDLDVKNKRMSWQYESSLLTLFKHDSICIVILIYCILYNNVKI